MSDPLGDSLKRWQGETVRKTLMLAADTVAALTDRDLDAARAGALAHGRSLAEVSRITLADVAVATLRVMAGRIK